MIHHIVGMRSTLHMDTGASGAELDLAGTALRFVEREQCRNEEQRRYRRENHCRAPAVGLRDRAAEEKAQSAANRHAEHEECENA